MGGVGPPTLSGGPEPTLVRLRLAVVANLVPSHRELAGEHLLYA